MKWSVSASVSLVAMGACVAALALPAVGEEPGEALERTPPGAVSRLSQPVALRHYLKHPGEAPPGVDRAVEALEKLVSAGELGPRTRRALTGEVFNRDATGLPQNEESVTVCQKNRKVVVGGTNDYRGLLDPQVNFTGWQLSTDGGRSIANEGLLPAIASSGKALPSGGDPVTRSDDACNIYAGSLNYEPDPLSGENGIGVYRSTPATLRSCPQGQNPNKLTNAACWPTRRLVDTASVKDGIGHFLDKEWLDVGRSGSAGNVVWVSYTDFAFDVRAPLGFTGARIKAVRCAADLSTCTDPIVISGADQDVQFSDVTISRSGATLITWVEIRGELEQKAQTFVVKSRIAPPGSTSFGPTRIVAEETKPLPFGGKLHANDFRAATTPKSNLVTVRGADRPTVVWDRCRHLVLDFVCEEPEIVMSRSADGGRSWSAPKVISKAGDNYFPAISDENANGKFVVAYFTNRHDKRFHARQDVELVTVDAANGRHSRRTRATRFPNDSQADPVLGGLFIGDYIEVHLRGRDAYVHYNANYRRTRLLDQGVPIPQQDNYLVRLRRR